MYKPASERRYAAIRCDIADRNERNRNKFTPAQFELAEQLASLVDRFYVASVVYVNYRNEFIAVKVESPGDHGLIDRSYTSELTELLDQHNITIHRINGHHIYRIPRIVTPPSAPVEELSTLDRLVRYWHIFRHNYLS